MAKNVEEQMEMFEDGGLLQEGGSVDEVSGNEVPPGSLKKEVRDDIPAQLSEGEFVFPADVVRYYGLETLMEMRQRAKAGLQRMEDMGQMGNSEEATLPDDIPFSLEDLDIEEEEEYNYQVGGFVPPQGTGIAGYQQSQFANYQPTYVPYQMPSVMQQPYQLPQQQVTPVMQQPTGLPQFQQFVQAPKGMAPENREYINPQTQERRVITFINNQPTTPIPQGFVPLKEYKPEEAVVTPTTTTQPATVTGERGEASERDAGVAGAAQTAAASLGYSTGTTSPAKLAGMLLGTMTGIPGAGLLGAKAGQMLSKEQQETFGKYGTVDPGTGAVFGIANIPGISEAKVAQGFNPITGQKMAVFSGTPSPSYMGQQVKSAFGFAPSTYTKQTYNSPTPMGQMGLASTLDKAISNMKGYDITNPDVDEYSFQDITAEDLGFSPGQAGYEEAANNSGVVGNNPGDLVETTTGVGVITSSGQIKTSTGTVVQLGDKSLLGSTQENLSNIADHHAKEKDFSPSDAANNYGAMSPEDVAAALGDSDGPSSSGADTTGETGTGGSPSAGGGSEPEGPDSSEGSGGSSCFAAGTKFIMEDGTTKNIEDIKIGDKLKLGGRVYSTIQGDGLIETWYNYGTTKVTGNHAIFENGEWKRVKDAKEAIPALHKEEILYTLINENHRMVAEDGVVYTDYDEVDNTGIEEDLLIQLNGQNAEATAA